MKRAVENAASSTAKRSKRALCADLVTKMKPLLTASKRKCLAEVISHDRLGISSCGSNGSLWLASFEQPEKESWEVQVVSLNGTVEKRARGLQGHVKSLQVYDDEGIFIDQLGSMQKIDKSGSVVAMNVTNVCWFAPHEKGFLVLRSDSEMKTLERRGLDGVLRDTLELPLKIHSAFDCNATGDMLIFGSRSSVEKVDLVTKKFLLAAGGGTEQGCRDGYGSNARFQQLRRPFMDNTCNSIFVRDVQPKNVSRFCRINLSTSEVTTLDLQGLPKANIVGVALHFPHLHVITEDLHHFYVDLGKDISRSTFSEDMESVDWAKPSGIQFRLAGGAVVHADQRVLCARSAYFAAMLRPEFGMLEAMRDSIDFTTSPIDPETFRIVVSYLATDELKLTWNNAASVVDKQELLVQALKCLEVAALADQYQLPRLQRLAETFVLQEVLSSRDDMVLPLLEKTFGMATTVEQACWDALDSRAPAVLAATGEAEVARILERAPELRVKLVYRLARSQNSSFG